MSNENLIQNTEIRTAKKVTSFQTFSIPLILVLMGLVGWLIYDVYQLKKEIRTIEAELSVVGALARNADNFAHSHYSDVRMKENIENLDDALANTLQLRAVTFDWNTKEFPDMGFSNQTQIGMIAQEVEQVFPGLVSVDSDGYKMVNYAGLTPILLEAIKEQQIIINELQQQNADILERLMQLENIIGVTR